MKKKIVWLVVSCLMVLALVMASCGPAEEEEGQAAEEEIAVGQPKYGGTLIQCLSYEPMRFNSFFGHHYLAPSLYLTNEDMLQGDWTKGAAGTGEDDWTQYSKIAMPNLAAGCLAESWEFPDESTIIYHIRKGVHFHNKPPTNGRELDAYDVEYTLLNFWKHPESFHVSNSPWDDCFESIKATDKWTIEVKYKNRSDAWALIGDHSHIYPRDALEQLDEMGKWENSIGTGPFQLVDYTTGTSLIFKRFDNYWMKDPIGPGKGNQLPYVDQVKWLIILDASTRLSALRTGKIDQYFLTWEDADSMVKTNPELKYYSYQSGGAPGLHFKVDDPELPSYDKRVRQALMMAIDNEAIAEQFYGGHAAVLAWPCSPMKFLQDVYVPMEEMPEIVQEMFGYHPDKAKQLLAEAGYPNGFKTEIACAATDTDLLSIVKDMWSKIGVELNLDVKEYGALVNLGTSRAHKDMYYRVMPTTLPKDVDCLMPDQWLNFGGINDQYIKENKYRMDNLMILHDDEANAIGREFIKYILEKCYIIPLPEQESFTFWQPWLKNYHGEYSVGLADAYTWAKYIWIDQDLLKTRTGTTR